MHLFISIPLFLLALTLAILCFTDFHKEGIARVRKHYPAPKHKAGRK